MENLEKIKKINNTANAIRKAVQEYREYKHQERYDKLGFGFNKDDRFSACNHLRLTVDSWSGVYGGSSCSRILSVDAEIFHKHLLKVLNQNFMEIIKKVADSIEAEASEYKEKAIKELEGMLKQIQQEVK